MTVRSLSCPKCAVKVNVLATMQTVRCPGCGNIFSTSASAVPTAAGGGGQPPQGAAHSREKTAAGEQRDNSTMMLLAVGGGLAMVLLLCAVGIWTLTQSNEAPDKLVQEEIQPVLREATAEELAALKIVDIPEPQRRQIYDEVRASAETTTEKALLVPGGKVRENLENMLDATYENSLRQLAALHDMSVDQVRDIVLEGDLKNWDPRARSRAYRGGQRVYEDERTQGHHEPSPLQ